VNRARATVRCFAFTSMALCALAKASVAGPQDYCDLFAKEEAYRRTGQTELITGTIDNSGSASQSNSTGAHSSPQPEIWQRAYEQRFKACMNEYEVSKSTDTTKTHARMSRSKPTQHRLVQSPLRKQKSKAVSKAKVKANSPRPLPSEELDSQPKAREPGPQTKDRSKEKDQDQRGESLARRPAVKGQPGSPETARSSRPSEPKTKPSGSPLHKTRACFHSSGSLCSER
jgi:hypothetical protein